MWSSRSRNRISCVARDQAGNLPPSVEIFHLPPGPGKGSTNTSSRSPRPDSLDAYARNFPSGETRFSTQSLVKWRHGCLGHARESVQIILSRMFSTQNISGLRLLRYDVQDYA